ncbi:MAG: DUF1579 domain-containing protein [Ignavibacteria bacterium]|nr:DUF1579 domain-containing protein [Ignavibacteria bacterium]
MKKTFFMLISVIAVLANSITAFSQDDQTKKWMDYMTPSEMHKMLSNGAGMWDVKSTFWMTPGGEPNISTATAESEMIMDGRYLQTKISGNVMGMPFNGFLIEGYDNALKQFQSFWIDNMGTGTVFLTGVYDGKSKQINYTGKMCDPISGGMVDVREVVTYNSDGSTKMEMYVPGPEGKEFKTTEIISTKTK